jgi:hypothetical protein
MNQESLKVLLCERKYGFKYKETAEFARSKVVTRVKLDLLREAPDYCATWLRCDYYFSLPTIVPSVFSPYSKEVVGPGSYAVVTLVWRGEKFDVRNVLRAELYRLLLSKYGPIRDSGFVSSPVIIDTSGKLPIQRKEESWEWSFKDVAFVPGENVPKDACRALRMTAVLTTSSDVVDPQRETVFGDDHTLFVVDDRIMAQRCVEEKLYPVAENASLKRSRPCESKTIELDDVLKFIETTDQDFLTFIQEAVDKRSLDLTRTLLKQVYQSQLEEKGYVISTDPTLKLDNCLSTDAKVFVRQARSMGTTKHSFDPVYWAEWLGFKLQDQTVDDSFAQTKNPSEEDVDGDSLVSIHPAWITIFFHRTLQCPPVGFKGIVILEGEGGDPVSKIEVRSDGVHLSVDEPKAIWENGVITGYQQRFTRFASVEEFEKEFTFHIVK